MTAKLRAGVIGLGVGEKHISGYHRDGRCQVVAICDSDPDTLSEVSGRNPGIDTCASAADILNDPDIGVVSIATHDQYHCEQVSLALENGKHVFVEKPLCLHRPELISIIAAWKAAGSLRLSSNLILRQTPRFIELRNRIRAGALGTPYYLEGDYNYGRLTKITDGWRGDVPGYSVVHGGLIHLTDLILWLTADKVIRVSAAGNGISTQNTKFLPDDFVAALLTFENGAVAKLAANFGCVHPHFHNVSVYGTRGSFVQNHAGGGVYYASRDPDIAPEKVQSPYPGTQKGDMLPKFVSAILDGGEPAVTEQEVFDSMSVSLAIEEARSENRFVTVEYHC